MTPPKDQPVAVKLTDNERYGAFALGAFFITMALGGAASLTASFEIGAVRGIGIILFGPFFVLFLAIGARLVFLSALPRAALTQEPKP